MTKDVNGYHVTCNYAGIPVYTVEKDGKEVYFGYSITEIVARFGFNPNTEGGKWND